MAFDRTTEDCGNIVEFGHVNTRVPDQRLATAFYVTGLGLTRDPYQVTGLENMWVNAGAAQFHLPTGPAERMAGSTVLVVPSLAALRQRLERVRPVLAGTLFRVEDDGTCLRVHCPWGTEIAAVPPNPAFGRFNLGLARVEVDIPMSMAPGVARFYREVLGAVARSGDGFVDILTGLHTRLRFLETDHARVAEGRPHVQITVADFSGAHAKLLDRGLVTEESNTHQYRFHDVIDPDSGAAIIRLEHEVRSMRHPLFGRALVNRDPDHGLRHSTPGHEGWRWATPD